MMIVVNPHARAGLALAQWRRIAPAIAERWPHEVVFPDTEEMSRLAVQTAAAAGHEVVASASGDGGVHLALNALMDPATDKPRWPVALGAIGLGSSNDFHKPRRQDHDVGGIPAALDQASGRWVDLGRVDFVTPEGEEQTEYFVLNSSFGAVAEGNARYNSPNGVLAALKRMHVGAAIQWCSLETLVGYKNVPASVEVDGRAVPCQAITSLGVIKRVHFAGDMRYDTPVTSSDGHFDVNLCGDMGRGELVRAMLAIMSGRFLAAGLPKTHHWRATQVRVVPAKPAALELDGEVRTVISATFRLIPSAIRLCGPSAAL
jgi:diacylglycerol kinase (ATP)